MRRHRVTIFFLSLCILVFSIDRLQTFSLQGPSQPVLTPIQQLFFFDMPRSLAMSSEATFTALPKMWRGVSEWFFLKVTGQDPTSAEGPLFTDILHGQVWRLFSPCILHHDLLHILFNMIWLWMLSRPIEERIGPWKLVSLVLITGIGSNIVQYLMSGPLFLGYSGVVTGMAGFIWMRMRMAPWEGYPLQKATLLFLAYFVLAMSGLQVLSFLVQLATQFSLPFTIANSAHIAGGAIGLFLGRMSWFRWRMA